MRLIIEASCEPHIAAQAVERLVAPSSTYLAAVEVEYGICHCVAGVGTTADTLNGIFAMARADSRRKDPSCPECQSTHIHKTDIDSLSYCCGDCGATFGVGIGA